MSAVEKNLSAWEEHDHEEFVLSFLAKCSLDSDLPDVSDSLGTLEEGSAENRNITDNQNINDKENLDEKHILVEDKLLKENNEETEKKIYLPKEETSLISNDEKENVVLIKKDFKKELSVIDDESSSDSSSDYDSEDSDSLLTRGKEKTKKKSCRDKQYERPHKYELNQRSLQLLSSGFIVQNNTGSNWQPSSEAQHINVNSIFSYSPVQSVDSANFADCSINSPFNVSSPESGYDTQSSDVFSPSPPNNILPTFSRNLVEEEKDIQNISDLILEIEECLKSGVEQVNLPGLDDIGYNDYIEKMRFFLEEPNFVNDLNSETFASEHSSNLDGESSINGNSDYLPLDSLCDLDLVSDSQSTSNDNSISELECMQSALYMHEATTSAPYSVKSTKRKLDYKLDNIAKWQVRFSESFDEEKYLFEAKKVLYEIRGKKKCIDIEKQTENSKRTNLHNAVLSSNIERIYCLIEVQKLFFHSIQFEINSRDVFEKTALNYAEELKLPLIVDYLKENLAVKGV